MILISIMINSTQMNEWIGLSIWLAFEAREALLAA